GRLKKTAKECPVFRSQVPDFACILTSCNEKAKSREANRFQVEKYIEFNPVKNYSVPALYI
ncbi:hypothetical protein JS562_49920, partial [Agrobacterium sp. S2]|nr:hypothetical protein [Agrobacterium sp. S2]